jgi:hypothetical protein
MTMTITLNMTMTMTMTMTYIFLLHTQSSVASPVTGVMSSSVREREICGGIRQAFGDTRGQPRVSEHLRANVRELAKALVIMLSNGVGDMNT